ncbi:2-iminoacetate synthase ThiH [Desulforamulus aeronauticus]|uniref:2-iminoacetate synthase n=1 Tax=Desulforamulus aeronauticus DSM 10349 TaxID=1121421 RepID=A0A1M6QCT4_9FIRM|nr:2-iminoacetate synthase ThiH [Desulforamulus aeronauticus]SHK18052.1 2-iminoacetate synthase [Desulforamulus aeronauticus DSM 10349]
MAVNQLNHMEYMAGMEAIDSNIMDKVLNKIADYDYQQFNGQDVKKALEKQQLSIDDYAAILSPAALPYLEVMAQKAILETKKHFGNSVCMFTPLYIANYCENHCVYCGFNCKNKIRRGKLSYEEVEIELRAIAATGLKEILILTGESRLQSGVEYIAETVRLATKYFSTIGIEIYPLNSEEYAYLHQCGADFVSVYQETYNTSKYEQVHVRGPKRIFPYRFHAQERALLGGMRGVSFGALLGLDDYRKDAYAAGLHAYFIQQKYPHAEISFSTPRLRPYINNAENNPNDVHEKQLLQVMLAYRLFMPYAGITISTRERPVFRDHIIGMAATKISAGVRVGVGGHGEEEKGDEQFEISDARSVNEVHQMILNRGLQPVYTDYIRV